MWELDYKESWELKNWCFWTVVLEKTLENPLDSKEIKPVHPKGDQSWIFIGRTDAEAQALILWPPDANNWLTGKDPDAGKDWRQEKGMTEDEMVGWHHWLKGHEFEQLQELVIYREAWCATVHRSQRVGHDWVTELNLYRQQTGLLSQVSPGFSSNQGLPHPWKFFPPCSANLGFSFPLLFPPFPLLLCPPLFYLASKLLIILIREQFYLHVSVLDASGASLSNAHQGGYPPNRKTSLSLWSGCLLIQLLRKRLSLHYYMLFYSVAVWYFILWMK